METTVVGGRTKEKCSPDFGMSSCSSKVTTRRPEDREPTEGFGVWKAYYAHYYYEAQ
jgi:hypothetical protein